MRTQSRFSLFTLATLLAAPFPAFAIGDITCETPALTGEVRVVPLTADPADDVALTKVEGSAALQLSKLSNSANPDQGLFECVIGPLPPQNVLQLGGSGQAYVEHGLAPDTTWDGFSFELALPQNGLPAGATLTLLAVDFHAPSSVGAQYRVAVVGGGGTQQLALQRADGSAREIGRLPVGGGKISLAWAGGAMRLAHAGGTLSDMLASGSRPIAVRVGYLGVDAQPAGSAGIYVRDPSFVE